MDGFGPISGILGGLIASGKYLLDTITVGKETPYHTESRIIFAISQIYYQAYLQGTSGGWTPVFGIAWIIPGDKYSRDPINGLKVQEHDITFTNQAAVGLILILEA